jgi:benzodiazapine receptor
MDYIFAIILTFLPIIFGSIIALISNSGLKNKWYDKIKKPEWTPDSKVFAPVWSILYILMGYASFRIFQKTGNLYAYPLILYWIQLTLNLLWTPVFFKLNNLIGSIVIICLLWFFVLLTTALFYKYDKIAGILFIPYVIWISYALSLNAGVLYYNPDSL